MRDKAFKVASNPKYDAYLKGLVSMVQKTFDKKSSGGAIKPMPNYHLAIKHHRQIIRKFKRSKVYSQFRGNIWGVDLVDMSKLSKCNRGIKYLLCAIDLFRK